MDAESNGRQPACHFDVTAMGEADVQMRVHRAESGPTLAYLPGLHGDWTLVGPFRRAIAGRATLVEFTYPRTTSWSLADYGRAVAHALVADGIGSGWLLAESFGSQVAWAMVAEPGLLWRVEGVILAGGFMRYAPRWSVRLAERMFQRMSVEALQRQVRLYLPIARRIRYRDPADQTELEEFVRRRTQADKAAIAHRLGLIARADWREVAAATTLPVFHVAGLIDPVVFWWPVRRWLRRCCPGFRDSRLVAASDHNVLNCRPRQVADQILRWISQSLPLP